MISKPEHLEEDFFEEIPITSNGPPNQNLRVDGNGENKAGDQKEKDDDIGIEGDDNDDVSEGEVKSKKSVSWSEDLVSVSPLPSRPMPLYSWETPSLFYGEPPNNLSSEELRSKMENVKGMLGRWSKRVGEATKKAEDLAENTWQHLKTGPSIADAALGRIAQGTKVLAEGGYEIIFHQTFETVPEEKLQDAFACYLSTSAGPVMGVLYVSTEKLAYCSDNPLSYKDSDTTEWSYYKVTIPLYQLKAVNPSSSSIKPNERYIQVKSVDNHEFWFMGFLNYSVAENLLKEVLEARSLQSA